MPRRRLPTLRRPLRVDTEPALSIHEHPSSLPRTVAQHGKIWHEVPVSSWLAIELRFGSPSPSPLRAPALKTSAFGLCSAAMDSIASASLKRASSTSVPCRSCWRSQPTLDRTPAPSHGRLPAPVDQFASLHGVPQRLPDLQGKYKSFTDHQDCCGKLPFVGRVPRADAYPGALPAPAGGAIFFIRTERISPRGRLTGHSVRSVATMCAAATRGASVPPDRRPSC
jgi:hypothetical protein